MDEDFLFDFATPEYRDEEGFIVASTPLTDEHWEPFRLGEIQVFRRGQRVACTLLDGVKA